ncbi:unnamed protein product [Paramecium sonneborni]|uniref:GST N-terminal domain-containing protein n=1 Tax=Paramecium sonneborni TaxID=65129 RepID=A0A8S1RUD0_9CILI|nr:unnamed protein product [Paramecium sonneborni]
MFKIPELYLSHQDYFYFIKQQKYKNQFIQSILNKSPKLEQITLYFHPLSSPSRAVRSLLLLAKIEFNEKIIDILKSENKSDQYSLINPNQTVPSIKQGSFTLFESHAILKYICEQYRLSDFYPQDNLKLKAQIDSYLDFHLNEMKQITEYVMISQNNQNQQELKEKQKNKKIQINCYYFLLKFFLMKENINTSTTIKLSQLQI